MPANETVTSSNQYLTFYVAGEEYAISILQVTDIIECGAVTKVPGTPAWIRGVHNLRGAVVPVIDLAVKFGLPATVVTRRTCIVIVEVQIDGGAVLMGLMADSVHQVADLDPEAIQPPPAFGSRVRVDALAGMCASPAGFTLILDIDRVLADSEVVDLSTAPAEAMGPLVEAPAASAEIRG